MEYADDLLTYSEMGPATQVFAFSTTRRGGCSSGAYASMNCTPYTGDEPDAVHRNQELLRARLPVEGIPLIIPYQTHGTASLVVDKEFLSAPQTEQHSRLQAIDALLTDQCGVCLCVSTADCIPILLYDIRHRAIAAIHAGWRGTVERIAVTVLRQMNRQYGTCGADLHAVIGPGISQEAFEVGDEVYEAFSRQGFPMEYISGWKPETHKYHIDLPAANLLQLLESGIPETQIVRSGICTYTHHDVFFSARRSGIRSGRILTGITLLTK